MAWQSLPPGICSRENRILTERQWLPSCYSSTLSYWDRIKPWLVFSSDNEHSWEAPLEVRHPILIAPVGALKKEMANHSNILAWRIPWTEEPGGLQSMESWRVGHSWAANTYTYLASANVRSITKNKASGGDGISVELFQILKDYAVKVLHSNMPANLENSAVATGLEKVSFHSNPKERQCQIMLKLPHNSTRLTR